MHSTKTESRSSSFVNHTPSTADRKDLGVFCDVDARIVVGENERTRDGCRPVRRHLVHLNHEKRVRWIVLRKRNGRRNGLLARRVLKNVTARRINGLDGEPLIGSSE